jgi:alkylhydroperoxidase family enzyme
MTCLKIFRLITGLGAAAVLLCQLLLTSPAVRGQGASPHSNPPRIPPVEEKDWSQPQRELLTPLRTENGQVLNLYKTLVRYPELFSPRLEFGRYIQRESSLPAHDRELLICRIAWLSGGEYEWTAHSRIALQNGWSAQEVERIAKGPEAPGWNAFDQALLRAADELFRNIFITDETWKTLASRYTTEQMMDAVMTVGGYHMLAMALNTFGVPVDTGPAGVPWISGTTPVEKKPFGKKPGGKQGSGDMRFRPKGSGGIPIRLKVPRIEAVTEANWSPEQREFLAPIRQDRGYLPNVYATMARNPQMYRHWIIFARHILRASSLPAREREMLICRTAWLSSGEYEWAAHVRIGKQNGLTDDEIQRLAIGPGAAGWPVQDAAVVRAVDELFYDGLISDAAWKSLAERFQTPQLMDLVFTVGAYKMLAMALNSFGMQLDSDMTGFAGYGNPKSSARRSE